MSSSLTQPSQRSSFPVILRSAKRVSKDVATARRACLRRDARAAWFETAFGLLTMRIDGGKTNPGFVRPADIHSPRNRKVSERTTIRAMRKSVLFQSQDGNQRGNMSPTAAMIPIITHMAITTTITTRLDKLSTGSE
jgi:hypothetical protein